MPEEHPFVDTPVSSEIPNLKLLAKVGNEVVKLNNEIQKQKIIIQNLLKSFSELTNIVSVHIRQGDKDMDDLANILVIMQNDIENTMKR